MGPDEDLSRMSPRLPHLKIMIRGAGEMATGTACRLYGSGFHRILMTEIEQPVAIRRCVCFSEAVYDGTSTVEGFRAVAISSLDQVEEAWNGHSIAVIVDPQNNTASTFKPDILIDAILAKKNLGTSLRNAPLVIGLGPGFCAGRDVHFAVETNRGHDLGRLIDQGMTEPDTGTPGNIAGEAEHRVIRAPSDGILEADCVIGTPVIRGQAIGRVGNDEVLAGLSGVLRGLIRPGIGVHRGLKIGDVDPRAIQAYCTTISDKARAIGGSVLEAILRRFNRGSES